MSENDLTIHYSGPPELSDSWDALATLYFGAHKKDAWDKTPAYCIRALNTFNTLTFGTPEQQNALLQEVCKPPGSSKELTEHKLSPIANDLCELAYFVSQYGARGQGRKLQDHVAETFVKFWVETEKGYGLYPPVSIAHLGSPNPNYEQSPELQAVLDRREAVLSSSKGSFLFNFLKSTGDAMLQSNISKALYIASVRDPDTKNDDSFRNDIIIRAERSFTNSLFSYELGHGVKLINYANSAFKSFFFKDISKHVFKYSDRNMHTVRMDAPRSDEPDAPTLADTHLELQSPRSMPYERLLKNEEAALQKKLGEILRTFNDPKPNSPRNKRIKIIVTDYLGLQDNQPQTLEEIGTKLGITRERVRQLKEAGFTLIRKELSGRALLSFDNSIEDVARPRWAGITASEIARRWDLDRHYTPEVNNVIEQTRAILLDRVAKELDLPRDADAVEKRVEHNFIFLKKDHDGVARYQVYPLAMDDVDAGMQKFIKSLGIKRQGKGLETILEECGVSTAYYADAQKILEHTRNKIVDRVAKAYRLPPHAEAVVEKVDNEYISLNVIASGARRVRVYPAAMDDVSTALNKFSESLELKRQAKGLDFVLKRWDVNLVHAPKIRLVIHQARQNIAERVAQELHLPSDADAVLSKVNNEFIGLRNINNSERFVIYPQAMAEVDAEMKKYLEDRDRKKEAKGIKALFEQWNLHEDHSPAVQQIILQVREHKIDQVAQELGLPRDAEAVQAQVNDEYIGIRTVYGFPKYQIYPDALSDINTEMPKLCEHLNKRKEAKGTDFIAERWGMKPFQYPILNRALEQARNHIVSEVAGELHLPHDADEVQAKVENDYICLKKSTRGAVIAKIYPDALVHIDAEIKKHFASLERKKTGKVLADVLDRWGLSHNASTKVTPVIGQAWQNIAERLATESGLTADTPAIQDKVNENFIEKKVRQNGAVFYTIYPEGLADVDAEMHKSFPNRAPKEISQEQSR